MLLRTRQPVRGPLPPKARAGNRSTGLVVLAALVVAAHAGDALAQQISPAEQQARDERRFAILQEELTQEQRALVAAKTPEDIDHHQRNINALYALLQEVGRTRASPSRSDTTPRRERRQAPAVAASREETMPPWSIYARRARHAGALAAVPSESQE